MKKGKLTYFSFLVITVFAVLAIVFSSCSAQKKYGQSVHKNSHYQRVRVKQAKWNTTTSTSTTYYIKKQKQPKRYNP
ncbi:MAG: hypothetical protein MJZ52_02325 [Bacteroidales bacterium]|nr:hypothetical protein [Bacteroidales bacterium]